MAVSIVKKPLWDWECFLESGKDGRAQFHYPGKPQILGILIMAEAGWGEFFSLGLATAKTKPPKESGMDKGSWNTTPKIMECAGWMGITATSLGSDIPCSSPNKSDLKKGIEALSL